MYRKIYNFTKSLHSIAAQTRAPHAVFISYSFALQPPDENEWRSILNTIPLITLKHTTKQYQIDHYKHLLAYINDDDIVCFLEDDDLYTPNKIEKVWDAFNQHPIRIARHCLGSFKSLNPTEKDSLDNIRPLDITEHYSYCIIGAILKEFFKTTAYIDHSPKLRGFTDLILTAWLQYTYNNEIHQLNDTLMYIRYSHIQRDYNKP